MKLPNKREDIDYVFEDGRTEPRLSPREQLSFRFSLAKLIDRISLSGSKNNIPEFIGGVRALRSMLFPFMDKKFKTESKRLVSIDKELRGLDREYNEEFDRGKLVGLNSVIDKKLRERAFAEFELLIGLMNRKRLLIKRGLKDDKG